MDRTTAKSGRTEGRIKRFGPYRIFEHWTHAVVFTILVITGLSQRFHTYDLSQWLVLRLGGIDAVRIMHRVAGFILILIFFLHVLIAAWGVIRMKWQVSMVRVPRLVKLAGVGTGVKPGGSLGNIYPWTMPPLLTVI